VKNLKLNKEQAQLNPNKLTSLIQTKDEKNINIQPVTPDGGDG
jgi:hypothetical protein